jgi:hypothetical protein
MSDFRDHELSSYLFGSHQVSAGRHYPRVALTIRVADAAPNPSVAASARAVLEN